MDLLEILGRRVEEEKRRELFSDFGFWREVEEYLEREPGRAGEVIGLLGNLGAFRAPSFWLLLSSLSCRLPSLSEAFEEGFSEAKDLPSFWLALESFALCRPEEALPLLLSLCSRDACGCREFFLLLNSYARHHPQFFRALLEKIDLKRAGDRPDFWAVVEEYLRGDPEEVEGILRGLYPRAHKYYGYWFTLARAIPGLSGKGAEILEEGFKDGDYMQSSYWLAFRACLQTCPSSLPRLLPLLQRAPDVGAHRLKTFWRALELAVPLAPKELAPLFPRGIEVGAHRFLEFWRALEALVKAGYGDLGEVFVKGMEGALAQDYWIALTQFVLENPQAGVKTMKELYSRGAHRYGEFWHTVVRVGSRDLPLALDLARALLDSGAWEHEDFWDTVDLLTEAGAPPDALSPFFTEGFRKEVPLSYWSALSYFLETHPGDGWRVLEDIYQRGAWEVPEFWETLLEAGPPPQGSFLYRVLAGEGGREGDPVVEALSAFKSVLGSLELLWKNPSLIPRYIQAYQALKEKGRAEEKEVREVYRALRSQNPGKEVLNGTVSKTEKRKD